MMTSCWQSFSFFTKLKQSFQIDSLWVKLQTESYLIFYLSGKRQRWSVRSFSGRGFRASSDWSHRTLLLLWLAEPAVSLQSLTTPPNSCRQIHQWMNLNLIFLCNALVWPAEGDIYHQLLQPEGSTPQVTTPVCVWGAFNVLQLFKDICVDGVCRLSVTVMWLILTCRGFYCRIYRALQKIWISWKSTFMSIIPFSVGE